MCPSKSQWTLCLPALFDVEQLIGARPHADGLGVLQAAFPVGLREIIGKVVVVVAEVVGVHILIQAGAGDGLLLHAGVGTGLVQGHRVEGGKHAHIGQDGQVVLGMAVAEGGDIHHQADVEVGPSSTALEYSAILALSSSLAQALRLTMASKLQAPRQRPQPTHLP